MAGRRSSRGYVLRRAHAAGRGAAVMAQEGAPESVGLAAVDELLEVVALRRKQSVSAQTSLLGEELSALYALFDKKARQSLRIVEQGAVTRYRATQSGRCAFRVRAKGPSDSYLCFPCHFCSCQSFLYDVVSKEDSFMCKHQLASRIAEATGSCKTVDVSDLTLANFIQNSL